MIKYDYHKEDYNANLGIRPNLPFTPWDRGLFGFFTPWNYKIELTIRNSLDLSLSIL